MTEADILEQVIRPDRPGISPEFARALLDLHFDETAKASLSALAEKNRLGLLTAIERADLEKYLRVGNFLNLLQAKARLSLSSPSAPSP